jgi:hypothetical protein
MKSEPKENSITNDIKSVSSNSKHAKNIIRGKYPSSYSFSHVNRNNRD